jgi:hypothetical protein
MADCRLNDSSTMHQLRAISLNAPPRRNFSRPTGL